MRTEIIERLSTSFTGMRQMLLNQGDMLWEHLCDELPAHGWFKTDDAITALMKMGYSPRTAYVYWHAISKYVIAESGSAVLIRVGNRYKFVEIQE